ncbi:MAG: hypothetical protein IJ595_11020 [Oscillospiraceae bacterium]|nr:hypothetical protein [Oscillospiraceae bacterium]
MHKNMRKTAAFIAALLAAGILNACGQTSPQPQDETTVPAATEQTEETTAEATAETEEATTQPVVPADPKDDPFYEEKYGYYADLAAEYEKYGEAPDLSYGGSLNYFTVSFRSNDDYIDSDFGYHLHGGSTWSTSGGDFIYGNGTVSFFVTHEFYADGRNQCSCELYTYDLETRESQVRSLDWWTDNLGIMSLFNGKCVTYSDSESYFDPNTVSNVKLPAKIHVFDLYDESFGYDVSGADLGMPDSMSFKFDLKYYIVLPNGAFFASRNSSSGNELPAYISYSPEEGLKTYPALEGTTAEDNPLILVGAGGDKVYFLHRNDHQFYYLDIQTGSWSKLEFEAAYKGSTVPNYTLYGKYLLAGGIPDDNYTYYAYSLIDLETAQSVAELHFPTSGDINYCGGESHFFAGYSMKGMIPGNGAEIDKNTKEIVRDPDNHISVAFQPLNETYFIVNGDESNSSMMTADGYGTTSTAWYIGTYKKGLTSLTELFHVNVDE